MQLNFLDIKNSDLSSFIAEGIISYEGRILFKELVYNYYNQKGRLFDWRSTNNPYYIWVSEVMLQQTQTERVKEKYVEFVKLFPTIEHLAQASFKEVLTVWQGLGYNRRAYALHESAQEIVAHYNGIVPDRPEILIKLKGIGAYTSCSIVTFAYNKPTIFIETNIRSVFIHTFFNNKEVIHDKNIIPLIEQTLDKNNPRKWYYALMDYGVMLKKNNPNPNRKSKHYAKQSKFEGSDRQIRSAILRFLLVEKLTYKNLVELLDKELGEKNLVRISIILNKLLAENLILFDSSFYFLP